MTFDLHQGHIGQGQILHRDKAGGMFRSEKINRDEETDVHQDPYPHPVMAHDSSVSQRGEVCSEDSAEEDTDFPAINDDETPISSPRRTVASPRRTRRGRIIRTPRWQRDYCT